MTHHAPLTARIPRQRPPPDPWAAATDAGARAFATGTGGPEIRAQGAVAAALFVYAQHVAEQYRHRFYVAVGKHGHMWAAARCTCGDLDGPRRRGAQLDEQVAADYAKHVNGED